MKQLKSISAEETLELIKKTWADKKDIQLLACCGKNRADDIRKKIEDEVEIQGYRLPTGKVPMDKLVEYLKINVNYLKKITK